MMDRIQDLQKLIKLTGDRAKLDAKANGTYIVCHTISSSQVLSVFNSLYGD